MLLHFPASHVRASAGSRACPGSRATMSANASKVISLRPRSAATFTRADQCGAGIPPGRVRHPATVESDSDRAAATAPVPPRSSMMEPGVAIAPPLVRTLRTCQGFASRETTFPPDHVPISSMIDEPKIVGARLKALRLAVDCRTQIEFAKEIGVEKNTYNPWEKGTRALTFEGALLIRKRYRVPLDYLFFGDAADELPARIVKKLQDAA